MIPLELLPGQEADKETQATDMALVDAIVPQLESIWKAQMVSITPDIEALPDNQKGRYLAVVNRLPLGKDLRPKRLSPWGKQYFHTVLNDIRQNATKPFYPK